MPRRDESNERAAREAATIRADATTRAVSDVDNVTAERARAGTRHTHARVLHARMYE